ncbi:diguanylate cyclase [Sphingomonas sp. SUN039]|uniref:GGDEF domain-containing protein n=1 Tax=Sphingomonas sp. SUN039 TaxID=2937787 RepID=UPI002164899D|nr:diguanylate cyclase [Sphingomonas sp. SUN039]UVO55033.1 diguanylate cyclase [Sphingomonas sp. SUN039]
MADDAETQRSGFARLASLAAPFPEGAPSAIRNDLIRLQYERLHGLTPLLHLTIAANTLAMAVAVMGDLPLWQQLTPPGIILVSAIVHLIRWRRRTSDLSIPEIWGKLGRAVPLAGGLGLVAGLWGVSAFVETERFYCVVAPVFVALVALVSANCLTSVPRAAIAAMAGALGPLVVKMLLFPNLGIRSMAVMLVLIGLLQGRLVLTKFAETVKMLTLQHEIALLAGTDALTGLKNRRAFAACLEELLAAGTPVTVAMIDLDGFKAANDGHGHQAGDTVLAEVAQRTTMVAGSATCIARLGGDEFALIFDGQVDPTQVTAEIDAVRAVIALPYAVGEAIVTVSASIGVASGPADGSGVSALMQVADRALYRDKRDRRSKRRRAA